MHSGVHIIKDPEVAKLFADDTRREILHFLRHHEMSVSDLAKALHKSHSSIIHHLNLLKEAGLIEETKIQKVRNIMQPFYQSVGKWFHVSYSLSEILSEDKGYTAWQEEMFQHMIDGLESFNLKIPKDKEKRVKELLKKYYFLERKYFEETISKQTNAKNFHRHVNRFLIKIITRMKLSQNEEHKNAFKELNEILLPLIEEIS